MSRKVRCENPNCSHNNYRSIATGSYFVDIPINYSNRYMYLGVRCDKGGGSEGVYLCKKCKIKFNICECCNYPKDIHDIVGRGIKYINQSPHLQLV